MRIPTLTLAASVLAGCAAQPTAAPSAAAAPAATASTTVSSSARSGLAFDPPGAGQATVPDLSRDARQPTADNGVTPATTTYNVSTSIQDTTTDGAYTQQTNTERTGTVRR